jgi:copper chaperone CopZ
MMENSVIRRIGLGAVVLFAVMYYGFRAEPIMPFAVAGDGPAVVQEAGTEKAVFVVHCYDEGHDALKGMKGVQKVDRGFRFFREINTVYYDPNVVTVEEMEKALKSAGTYVETIKE